MSASRFARTRLLGVVFAIAGVAGGAFAKDKPAPVAAPAPAQAQKDAQTKLEPPSGPGPARTSC